jgi:ribonuclease-3 family protein
LRYALYDMLDDEEKKIFRRGRNSNPATVPKNADMIDYRHATALKQFWVTFI